MRFTRGTDRKTNQTTLALVEAVCLGGGSPLTYQVLVVFVNFVSPPGRLLPCEQEPGDAQQHAVVQKQKTEAVNQLQ